MLDNTCQNAVDGGVTSGSAADGTGGRVETERGARGHLKVGGQRPP